MTKNIPLSLACGDYESIRALKEGSVTVDGVDLTVLTDMDSASRHWRMIRGSEFDIAELSLSSYLMAVDRKQPLEAIPDFFASQISPRIYLYQRQCGHKGAQGSDRQTHRRQNFSGDGDIVAARHVGA